MADLPEVRTLHPPLGPLRGMDKDKGGGGGGGITSGSGHTDGLWWVPTILMRQITPVEQERAAGLGPHCLIDPSFSPGNASPSHCEYLWGWPGHLEAKCPGHSGGRWPWLGGAIADSPWCTWSGRATGPGRPWGNPVTIIQWAKIEPSLCPIRPSLPRTKLDCWLKYLQTH